MSSRMYKPKQDNIEKLNRYIEKLKEDGNVLDGSPDRNDGRSSNE